MTIWDWAREHLRGDGSRAEVNLLFAFDSATGSGEGNHGKPGANEGKDGFNGEALMVSKVIGPVLPKERETAAAGEKQEKQAGGLEPEGIERTTYGNHQRFSTGKRSAE
jgi:hypothetical protein